MHGRGVVEVLFVDIGANDGGHGGDIEALQEAADGDDRSDNIEVREGFRFPHLGGVEIRKFEVNGLGAQVQC